MKVFKLRILLDEEEDFNKKEFAAFYLDVDTIKGFYLQSFETEDSEEDAVLCCVLFTTCGTMVVKAEKEIKFFLLSKFCDI